jgi:hypothetical protein
MKISSFAPSVVTASAPRATASSAPSPASQARSGYLYNGKRTISIQELQKLICPQLNSTYFTFPKEHFDRIMEVLSHSKMLDFFYDEKVWLFKFRKPTQRKITSIHITPPSLNPYKSEFEKLTTLFNEVYNTVFPKVEQYRNARGSLRKKRSRNR